MRCNLYYSFFFFNDTATTEIYTLSLHDALPNLARLLDRDPFGGHDRFDALASGTMLELHPPLVDLATHQPFTRCQAFRRDRPGEVLRNDSELVVEIVLLSGLLHTGFSS